MIKRITVRLDVDIDAQVLAALDAIPLGERNGRIRKALRREFGGEPPDLVRAINRLADIIESRGVLPAGQEPVAEKPAPQQADRNSPEFRAKVRQSVLGVFEKEGSS